MGRIGGLAVALGVGAAVVSGWSAGLASADDSAGSAGSPGSSSTESESAAAKSNPSVDNADSPGATTTTGTDISQAAERPAPPVGDVSEPTTKPSHPSKTATPQETGSDDIPSSTPAKPKGSDRDATKPTKTRTPEPSSVVADATQDATLPVSAGTEQAADAANRFSVAAAPPPRIREAASLRSAPTQSSVVATPTSEASPPDVVSVVSRLVSGVVNAVLSPFAASGTPGVPGEVPSMWALLAFVRREFESAVRSLTGIPAGGQTTGQTLPANTSAQPEQRTLILSAFPAEADAILARTTLDPNPTVVVDGHHFYLGSMGGKKVIVAMTGIGMVNATDTTETALSHFTPESGVSIDAVVFSGVAGGSGRTEIGSVAVPARWTSDDGATWHAVDPGMLAAANALTVDLESTAPLGDPLCLCSPFARLPLVDLNREPQLFVGGDGSSDDNNNGVAFPAIPLGGDIFGPQPCAAPDYSPLFFGNFFQAVAPFLAFGLFSNLTGLLSPVVPPVDAVDQETAAAQQVADAHGIPFLGIRGMSDGPGDPLNLPGYPFTFIVYRQLAADNAAIVTEAFLRSWDGTGPLAD
jgi:nucleoside phosphorylase